jgi:hypothetical protein
VERSFWIDNADFYDTEAMPGYLYFDSWEELQEMLQAQSGLAQAQTREARQAREKKVCVC